MRPSLAKHLLHILLVLVTILSPVSSVAVSAVSGGEHHLNQNINSSSVAENEHTNCHENAASVEQNADQKDDCCQDQCFCAQMSCHSGFLSTQSPSVKFSSQTSYSSLITSNYINPLTKLLSPPPIA